MPNNWYVSLTATSANPKTLRVNKDDGITWINCSGQAITLTLPGCVSPQDGPKVIVAGEPTGGYTADSNLLKEWNYSWAPGSKGKIKTVTQTTYTIVLSDQVVATLTVEPGDQITFRSGYANGDLTLTLPPCVSPNDSPVVISPGAPSRVYTVNAQHSSNQYSWIHPSILTANTGTIDVS